ncbi:MAG: F0F1 ATP synthase subunit gamma [Nitriliruptor sp.]|uniref:F0F1 ATP synthase subunit gamma n=1 Tax=Nitriliruptor sp. TaxID=2448056 RepID=UPI0034A019A7
MAGSGQIRQLRRRIKSVRSTQKITRAMEMIAASRIVKAQRRVREARPYAEQIHLIIKGLAASSDVANHPLLHVREETRTVAVVVLTSDRGLAGAYNANILKLAERTIRDEESAGRSVDVYVVGRKGKGYFAYRGRQSVRTWEGVTDEPALEDAAGIGETVMERYVAGELDKVWLVYTDFKSSLTQVPVRMELLPVKPEEFGGGDEIAPEFLFIPDRDTILDRLIPRYVEAKVFHGLLESSASEHAARQRAMKSATDNANDVASSMSQVMNQARQDQITTEISEIVGGAEALSQGR